MVDWGTSLNIFANILPSHSSNWSILFSVNEASENCFRFQNWPRDWLCTGEADQPYSHPFVIASDYILYCSSILPLGYIQWAIFIDPCESGPPLAVIKTFFLPITIITLNLSLPCSSDILVAIISMNIREPSSPTFSLSYRIFKNVDASFTEELLIALVRRMSPGYSCRTLSGGGSFSLM